MPALEAISVRYQDHLVGAVSYDPEKRLGYFEYSPAFIATGIELSPIKMPLRTGIYSFPALDYDAFKGLPGMLADSLPDDFGNAVLNAWVAAQGLSSASISPLQRLQYTGRRGMGALEYVPATQLHSLNASQSVQIASLVTIAQDVLDQREAFAVDLNGNGEEDREAMMALLSVGMSAGGARPKAVLAFNQDFTQVRSGQTDVPDGFVHYLMKFDGVSEHHQNRETFGDPMGYGAMEYVYYLMATACGITMMPCHLINEGNRRHFVTQRFDRVGNQKRHIQTLNGLAHVSYKKPGEYSYAELFGIARALRVSAEDADQLLRRMMFNVVARNHDDHSKNFAFMLDEQQQWALAPAYDIAYSYKPGSPWVNSHWMTLNGKRDDFTLDDFLSFSAISPLFKPAKIKRMLQEVTDAVAQWPELARQHGVPKGLIDQITGNLRLIIR
jgi:serine/threonine-protein kinase HipA